MLNLSNHYFEFGPFRLDLRERLLLRGDSPIPLTPKAFDVLAVLVRRNGRLVSKDELLSEVWPDTVVEESSLSQKIYQLRKILNESSEEDLYIQTVPRHGYRFIADVREVTSPIVSSSVETESSLEVTRSHILIEQQISDEFGVQSETLHTIEPRSLTESAWRPHTTTRVVALSLLVLVLSGIGIWLWHRQRVYAASHMPSRIAVLPFKVIGQNSGDEQLGLGIADALINKLNRTKQITVLPTNSIYRFDGQDYDSFSVGRRLGVEGVIDGTIQRIGEHIRVTAQLISLQDNRVLWAGQFDSSNTDIFSLQDSISLQLAESLRLELTRNEKLALTKRETRNAAAYEAYTTAIYFWNRRSKEGLTKAIDYFRKAIEADPSYAKAYAGLSDCYLLSVNYRYNIVSPQEAIKQQAEAARKALELDDTLSDAHLAMAQTHLIHFELAETNREYQRSLELDPSSSIAHMRYAHALFWSLKLDDAVNHMKLAQELDPTSAITNAALGSMFLMKRDYTSAAKYCERALELDPNTPLVRITLATTYEQLGKYDVAIEQYQKISETNPRLALAGIAHANALMGRRDQAKAILDKLASEKGFPQEDNYNQALVHTALGENDKAIALLEKLDLSPNILALLKYDPQLDSLRQDERYIEFARAHSIEGG